MKKTAHDRFKEKIKVMPNGCWQMTSSVCANGYASFWYKGRAVPAHRVSYELFVGSITDGLHVLHKCDNPACMSPKHLFLGTHADNMRDKAIKGRIRTPKGEKHWTNLKPEKIQRGSKHHHAKLTEADVLYIRNSKEQNRELVKRFGLERSTINKIRARKMWTHI